MIHLKVKKQLIDKKYWQLSLPAEYSSKADTPIKKMKLEPYSLEDNCYIFDLEESRYHKLPLQHLIGQKTNLNEAVHLFKQLEQSLYYDSEPLEILTEILNRDTFNIKEMINLMLNIDCYRLTDGLVEQVSDLQNLYNGKTLPPIYGDEDTIIVAKLESKKDGKIAYLSMPSNTSEIERTLDFMGCSSDNQCQISYPLYTLQEEIMYITDEKTLEEVADICRKINSEKEYWREKGLFQKKTILCKDVKTEIKNTNYGYEKMSSQSKTAETKLADDIILDFHKKLTTNPMLVNMKTDINEDVSQNIQSEMENTQPTWEFKM